MLLGRALRLLPGSRQEEANNNEESSSSSSSSLSAAQKANKKREEPLSDMRFFNIVAQKSAQHQAWLVFAGVVTS